MLYLVDYVAHFLFWVATLVIAVNATLIVIFGRESDNAELGYRHWDDGYVMIGSLWLLFGLGFYLYSDYTKSVTIFMLVGALGCIQPLKDLYERSLDW